MSQKFPIVALTGASGAGKTNVKEIFQEIFKKLRLRPVYVEGDSFHRYSRDIMDKKKQEDQNISLYSPEANLLQDLELLFRRYSNKGSGQTRHYIHSAEEAITHRTEIGNFTGWKAIARDTNLLFYEGLHGGYVDKKINVAQHVDLLVGVAPIINLEWMQKINRDRLARGYSRKGAVDMILSRLPDYSKYICPQFSLTDANLQRIPLLDSSNPFSDTEVPSDTESLFLLNIKTISIDLKKINQLIPGSMLSSPTTIITPGTSLKDLLSHVFTPVINRLVSN